MQVTNDAASTAPRHDAAPRRWRCNTHKGEPDCLVGQAVMFYKYVVGSESRRAHIGQIPDVTFVALSTEHAQSDHF
jgi:hypothetical protein